MASIVGKKGIPTCILVRKEEVRGCVDRWREGRRERVENRGGGEGTFLPLLAQRH